MRKPDRSIPTLRKLLDRLNRFFRPWIEPVEPAEPEDPYAFQMAPLRRPPSKGGAAAVAEYDDDEPEPKLR